MGGHLWYVFSKTLQFTLIKVLFCFLTSWVFLLLEALLYSANLQSCSISLGFYFIVSKHLFASDIFIGKKFYGVIFGNHFFYVVFLTIFIFILFFFLNLNLAESILEFSTSILLLNISSTLFFFHDIKITQRVMTLTVGHTLRTF